MKEIDDPAVLRREIIAMLRKVTDRGSLLFFQWLLRRVFARMPIPGDEELRALHEAFKRANAALRARKRPSIEDMELLAKWAEGDDAAMGRALGRTVRFYREKAGLSRLQLAKKAGLPLRLILRLERGTAYSSVRVDSIDQLAKGLGVDAGDFTDKIMDYEKGKD